MHDDNKDNTNNSATKIYVILQIYYDDNSDNGIGKNQNY